VCLLLANKNQVRSKILWMMLIHPFPSIKGTRGLGRPSPPPLASRRSASRHLACDPPRGGVCLLKEIKPERDLEIRAGGVHPCAHWLLPPEGHVRPLESRPRPDPDPSPWREFRDRGVLYYSPPSLNVRLWSKFFLTFIVS